MLRLPGKVTLHLHQILRLPRKMHSTFLFYSLLLYFLCLYSQSSILYSTILFSTPLFSSLRFSTPLSFPPLFSTPLFWRPQFSTPLFSSLPFSTLLFSTPPFSTPLCLSFLKIGNSEASHLNFLWQTYIYRCLYRLCVHMYFQIDVNISFYICIQTYLHT